MKRPLPARRRKPAAKPRLTEADLAAIERIVVRALADLPRRSTGRGCG